MDLTRTDPPNNEILTAVSLYECLRQDFLATLQVSNLRGLIGA